MQYLVYEHNEKKVHALFLVWQSAITPHQVNNLRSYY